MKKRVFIIHGWGGNSKEGWFPWLKKELEPLGYEVFVPDMPDTENPRIEAWVSFLSELTGNTDKQTYFVGHSIGCQTILRYLEKLQPNEKIGGCVFVAPWFTLMNQSEEEEKIAKPWIETPIDLSKVKKTTDNIRAIFSDNDPFVPLDNQKIFKDELGAKILIENNKGHLSEEHGVTKLPSVLEAILDFN